jgi:hypothetical protein
MPLALDASILCGTPMDPVDDMPTPPPEWLPFRVQCLAPAPGPDGGLLLVSQRCGELTLRRAACGGALFGPPIPIRPPLVSAAPPRTVGALCVRASPTDGRLLILQAHGAVAVVVPPGGPGDGGGGGAAGAWAWAPPAGGDAGSAAVDAQWHPLSPEHFGVLTRRGELRLFCARSGGAAAEAVGSLALPAPAGGAPWAAFSFGAPGRGWEALAAFALAADGAAYVACPVAPPGLLLPSPAFHALRAACLRVGEAVVWRPAPGARALPATLRALAPARGAARALLELAPGGREEWAPVECVEEWEEGGGAGGGAFLTPRQWLSQAWTRTAAGAHHRYVGCAREGGGGAAPLLPCLQGPIPVAPAAWGAARRAAAQLRPFCDLAPLPAALCPGPALALLRSDGEVSLAVGAEPVAPAWAAASAVAGGGGGGGCARVAWRAAPSALLTPRPPPPGARAGASLARRLAGGCWSPTAPRARARGARSRSPSASSRSRSRSRSPPPSPRAAAAAPHARAPAGSGAARGKRVAARPEESALPWLLAAVVPGAPALGGAPEAQGVLPAGAVGVAEFCVDAGAGGFAAGGGAESGGEAAGVGARMWGGEVDVLQAPLLVGAGALRPGVICVAGRGGAWRVSAGVAGALSAAVSAWEEGGAGRGAVWESLGARVAAAAAGAPAPHARALHALALAEAGGVFEGGATGLVGFVVPPGGPQWDEPAVAVAVGAEHDPLAAAAPWVGAPPAPPGGVLALVVPAPLAGEGAGGDSSCSSAGALCVLSPAAAREHLPTLRPGEPPPALLRSPALLRPGDVVRVAPGALAPARAGGGAGGPPFFLPYAAPGGRGGGDAEDAASAPAALLRAAAAAAEEALRGGGGGDSQAEGAAAPGASFSDLYLSSASVASAVAPLFHSLDAALEALAAAEERGARALGAGAAEAAVEAVNAAGDFAECAGRAEASARALGALLAAKERVLWGVWEAHWAAVGAPCAPGGAHAETPAPHRSLLAAVDTELPQAGLPPERRLAARCAAVEARLAAAAARARRACARAEAAAAEEEEAEGARARGRAAVAEEEVADELLTMLDHARVWSAQWGGRRGK